MLKCIDFAPCTGQQTWVQPLNVQLQAGEWLLVQGRNGSGRSTVAQALAGHLDHQGELWVDGQLMSRWVPEQRFMRGMTYVPEHRDVFADLTPIEHLRLGMGPRVRWNDPTIQTHIHAVLERLPTLNKRKHLAARYLSGGEQQLLSVARALVSGPRCVVLDEPFEGLASAARHELLSWMLDLQGSGLCAVWFEQSTPMELNAHVGQRMTLNQAVWSK